MIFAQAVCEPIYNFVQMAFANNEQVEKTPFSHKVATQLLTQLATRAALPIKDAINFPPAEGRALKELLTQYIMFFTMNPSLPFPPDFLQGSNDLQLGSELLRYFSERKFPFPQLLPQ